MTPVLKGVLTDLGFDNTVKAQQVFGGHGYIAEWGMEQFVRDARIAMIYEGANGIQALDLVGRKLAKDGGRAVMAFFNEVAAFCQENAATSALKPFLEPLGKRLGDLQQATMWFMQNAHGQARQCRRRRRPTTCTSSAWSRSATCGRDREGGDRDEGAPRPATRRTDGRQALTGRFFMERMLPETAAHLGPHRGRRRDHDGAAGGDVLTVGIRFCAHGAARRVR